LLFLRDGQVKAFLAKRLCRSSRNESTGENAAVTTDPTLDYATLAATIILNKALELGIRVGAAPDGSELILVAPLRIPYDVRHWFEVWLDNFRDEAIDIILRENGVRT
jgi:hypothetical protein